MMTSKFDETIKKIIPGHILVKLLHTSDKREVLKASKERDTHKDEDDNWFQTHNASWKTED